MQMSRITNMSPFYRAVGQLLILYLLGDYSCRVAVMLLGQCQPSVEAAAQGTGKPVGLLLPGL